MMPLLYYSMLLLLLIYLILTFIYFITHLISSLVGVPFVKTSKDDFEVIFANIGLNKKSHFYELGSGTADISTYIYDHYTHEVTAIEANPILQLIATIKKQVVKRSKMTLLCRNALNVNFEDATHIYMYMLPHFSKKIGPKILAECTNGTIIISYCFKIPLLSSRLNKTGLKTAHPIYYYKI